jgi:predicted DNA-binding mobile mystery protein A
MNHKLLQRAMKEQIQNYSNLLIGALEKPRPKNGWIKVMRSVLGMSSYQLAARMDCKQSNIISFEKREREETISLKSLQHLAKALNCRFVYAFVPEKTIDEILETQAKKVIKAQMKSIEHSMDLEQQGLTPEQKKQNETMLVQELLQGNRKKLWEIL